MQRYRRLTIEELEAVRLEFVKFLASEGIAAEDWERKLREGLSDAEACLDEFSEKFWDSATAAIAFLEHRPGSDNLWVFHFGESAAHVIQCSKQNGHVQWSQGGKNYAEEARGREVFLLLEQGAQPCSEDRFKEVHDQMTAATHQA
jgi:hypothetical protein